MLIIVLILLLAVLFALWRLSADAQGEGDAALAQNDSTPPPDATADAQAAGGEPEGEAQPPAESTPPPTPRSTSDPAADWRLVLVNPWNPLPEREPITLTELRNGQSVDERCYKDLQLMMDDCRAEGLSPLICSSYRTQEKQEQLFSNKLNSLLQKGRSEEEARAEAARSIAPPGTSEHQLGLAVDIVDINNQNLDDTQEKAPVQQWLLQNCWRYGFILRYPADKQDITGISWEPWHYRYVGHDHAKAMFDSGVCLEEYLDGLAQ